jgi:23S rRNA (adenine-N6)-dimethyltransferase
VAVRSPGGARGQHFLRSSRLAAWLVREAGVTPGQLVVEIGAGVGALTAALAHAEAEVVALELDAAYAASLRRRFSRTPTVRIVECDALSWAWPEPPFSVLANLPFARSGAILERLLGVPRRGPEKASVIVQWEFAAKHAAVWPSTRRATYWRAWYEVSIAGRLARTAFTPPPSVDAAVLRLRRRSHPLVAVDDHDAYLRFLSSAFARQLPIKNALAPQISSREVKRLAPTLGFAPTARARDLDAAQWAELFAYARRARRGARSA